MMETLKKVKPLSNGLYVEFKEPSVFNQKKYDTIPHPDLLHAMMGLKPFLASSHKMFIFQDWSPDLFGEKELPAMQQLKDTIGQWDDEMLRSLEITGLHLSGDNQNYAAIISGTHNCKGTKVAINSPRINIAVDANGGYRNTFGFEAGLSEQVERIKTETHEFLYNGKKGEATAPVKTEGEEIEFPEPEETESA